MGIRDNSINNINRDTQAVKIDATFPYTVDGIRYGIQIPSTPVVKNTLDDSVKAIAHRGYSADAPENTLPAYVLASQKGFSYVECDVNFTSDGVPVLLHDDTINRTSNGVGSINDLTLEQVRTYDFGAWKNAKYTDTKIPTLKEFLQLCFKLNLHPYIELKSLVGDATVKTQIIIDMVERLGMKGRVSYIGSLQAMTIVKDLDGSARIGVVTSTSVGDWLPTLQGLQTGTNQVFADALIGTYTEAEIQSAAEADIRVEIWTTNTVSDVITAANLGISGITTDNLNIRQILNESYG
jgi:glycerophosphoryl diester phosphodiesterase